MYTFIPRFGAKEGHKASQEQEERLAKEIKMDMAGKHICGYLFCIDLVKGDVCKGAVRL